MLTNFATLLPVSPAPGMSSSTDAFTEAWEAFFLSARRARGRAMDGGGLSVPQFHLVMPLADGPQPVGRLAEAAGVAKPTATRMVEGLARDGLVERHACAEDRRKVLVELTEEGRAALIARRRDVQGARRKLAAALTEDERREAVHLLRKLADQLDDL